MKNSAVVAGVMGRNRIGLSTKMGTERLHRLEDISRQDVVILVSFVQ